MLCPFLFLLHFSLPSDAHLKEILDAAAHFLRGYTEYSLEVRRHAVLHDCLKAVDRKAFHPSKRIKVYLSKHVCIVIINQLGTCMHACMRIPVLLFIICYNYMEFSFPVITFYPCCVRYLYMHILYIG